MEKNYLAISIFKLQRLRDGLVRRFNNLLYRILFNKFGYHSQICRNVMIRGASYIQIGNKVIINDYSILQANEKAVIKIGDNVTISYGAKIITGGLILPVDKYRTHKYESIIIGSNVWIGAGAIILPGTIIGNNVVVAAGSVVNKHTGNQVLVGGIPAKPIKRIEKV